MESLLLSVLLRQEQMIVQWDSEFEQQKQLFLIHASTLIDMLPSRLRKKRLGVKCRVQRGSVLGHDKENLVGFQRFFPNSACMKSPKTKSPYSRGLAGRDLNTRYCYNDVKDVLYLHSKRAESKPSRLQSALLYGQDSENGQTNRGIARAGRQIYRVSGDESVVMGVPEGDDRQTHVSPSTSEMPSWPVENRKRIRGVQEENVILRVRNGEKQEVVKKSEKERIRAYQMSEVGVVEKTSEPKRARVIGNVKGKAAVVECGDAETARFSGPEIGATVKVGPRAPAWRDALAVEATELDTPSKEPIRRGRATGASAAVKASAPDVVIKDPVRRGRAKKTPAVSGAAMLERLEFRVTRSRARKVENVVESELGTSDEVVGSQFVSKEPVQKSLEVAARLFPVVEDFSAKARYAEPTQGDSAANCGAQVESRLANLTEEGMSESFCKSVVCAPRQEGVTGDEPSIMKAPRSKGRKSLVRSRRKYPENDAVACCMEKLVPSHAESQVKAASSHPGAEKHCVRIESRVAEILASIGDSNTEHSKDCQSESLPESRLERLKEDVGHRVTYFAFTGDPLGSRHGGTALQDGSASLGPCDALPAKEKSATCAHCVLVPQSDALVEEISVGGRKTVSHIQVKVTADGRLASDVRALRPSDPQRPSASLAVLPLGRDPVMTFNATSIKELSKSLPTHSKGGYTTLPSEMIEERILFLKKLGVPVSSPESLIVGRPFKPYIRCERPASGAFALEVPDAGRDASDNELHLLPNASISRRSAVEAGSADWRDDSVEHGAVVEGHGTGSDRSFEDCGIDGNIQFAVSSWHTKGESVEDGVVNPKAQSSRVQEPENPSQSLMDTTTQEQVISDAVSPLRYPEAIGDAMQYSLDQKFLRDETLTLNRLQFRKRLSARSKARARRWRSDVATNGLDYERGQSPEAPAASPNRVVSSSVRFMKGAAYAPSLEAQSPNVQAALGAVETGFRSGAEKGVTRADTTFWQPEGMTRRFSASRRNDVFNGADHDGEMGDNSGEYEVMKTADANRNSGLLLKSIYKLHKACENKTVGVGGIFKGDERQQVHSLIESAKLIMEHASSKGAQGEGAPLRTPASDHPVLYGSGFYVQTSLYRDRFKLSVTPRSSQAAPTMLPPYASTFPVSNTPVVVSVLSGGMDLTSPQMKRLVQKTFEEAMSKAPGPDFILSESVVGSHCVVSPARSRTPRSGEMSRTPETCNIHHFGIRVSAPDCLKAVGSGFGGFTSPGVHVHSYVHPSTIVHGTSTIGSARPLSGSQNVGARQSCDGRELSFGDRMGAVDTAKFFTHQVGVLLSPDTIAETEKLYELRPVPCKSSEDYVIGTSTTAKDLPNVLGDEPEVSIEHLTNPPFLMTSPRFFAGYVPEQEKDARMSVKTSLQSSKEVDMDAVEDGEPAVTMDRGTKVPCSPIYNANEHGLVSSHDHVMENLPLVHPQQTSRVEEAVLFLEGSTGPPKETLACSRSMPAASASSMQRVRIKGPSNLVGSALGPVPSSSNLARSNLASGIHSFIPLVQHMLPAASHLNGKRGVKVKALEAAEAAKRLAEQKELEKQDRKNMINKRENQERAAPEKLAKREHTAPDKPMKQRKARAGNENVRANNTFVATARPMVADPSNRQRTRGQNVYLKVKKTDEFKLKMNEDKQDRLQEEQRRKEEESKEVANVAGKRKHEAAQKKELEEKRRRQEQTVKAHRQMEKWQRLELEKKAQKQKALEEMEKERKAIEELKLPRRLDKVGDVKQRRKEQEKVLARLHQKVTLKLKDEPVKFLETEGRQQDVQMRHPSEDPAMPSSGPCNSFMASLHVAMGIGGEVGAARLSGVNKLVNPQSIRSQSWVEHLRVPQRSGEDVEPAFPECRDCQAAKRVPHTTPEDGLSVSNIIGGSGKPLFCAQLEGLGNLAVASIASFSGDASSATVLKDGNIVRQGQSVSRSGVSAVPGGNKPNQPGQIGFVGPPAGVIEHGDYSVLSYEISPFRGSEDEDSDEEKRFRKPIPQWARKEFIWPQLVRQRQQDPDDIFDGANSCSLDEVFEVNGSKKMLDYKRRGSSGDWVKDCLTWREQIQYKVTMGYLPQIVN